MADNPFQPDSAVPFATLRVERPRTDHPAPPPLLITVTPADLTGATVGVTGELDLAVIDELTQVLNAQLEAGRRHVLIDVSDLAFCSCAGLGSLMASRHRFAAVGGTLTLTGLERYLGRLLRLTDLEQFFAPPGPVAGLGVA